MPHAALEVEIINKVTNIGAIAEEKAALSGLSGGGAGGVFLGSPGSGAAAEAETKRPAAAADNYGTKVREAAMVTGTAGGAAQELTGKMSALSSLGITPTTAALLGAVAGVSLLVDASKSA